VSRRGPGGQQGESGKASKHGGSIGRGPKGRKRFRGPLTKRTSSGTLL
jgi:hypothetical protein